MGSMLNLQTSGGNDVTMSSREIADLVEKRHDNVLRTMETLAARGAITLPQIEDELVHYFKKRLELSDKQYEQVMQSEPKSWTDYPTYKKRFERLRPLFFILAKANLVPMSFYLKYCFPSKVQA